MPGDDAALPCKLRFLARSRRMTERNEPRADADGKRVCVVFASLVSELENAEEAGEKTENAEAEIECLALG